jgi:hypothetical protein
MDWSRAALGFLTSQEVEVSQARHFLISIFRFESERKKVGSTILYKNMVKYRKGEGEAENVYYLDSGASCVGGSSSG